MVNMWRVDHWNHGTNVAHHTRNVGEVREGQLNGSDAEWISDRRAWNYKAVCGGAIYRYLKDFRADRSLEWRILPSQRFSDG